MFYEGLLTLNGKLSDYDEVLLTQIGILFDFDQVLLTSIGKYDRLIGEFTFCRPVFVCRHLFLVAVDLCAPAHKPPNIFAACGLRHVILSAAKKFVGFPAPVILYVLLSGVFSKRFLLSHNKKLKTLSSKLSSARRTSV